MDGVEPSVAGQNVTEPPAGLDAAGGLSVAGLDVARIRLRNAGYCVLCDRIVERDESGACSNDPGHPAQALSGTIWLGEGEEVPQLPAFNWGAFLVPPVWGPAHGQWAGAIFLPVWLFVDSAVAAGVERGGAALAGAMAIASVTAAVQYWFAKRANGLAWRRVCDRMALDEFARRERIWAVALVPVAVLLLGWATYYRLVFAAS